MHNYSDTMACAHHDEDKAQVMRAVFCPFMRHCCKAQLINNYRNESLWHWSGYFCIDICKSGGVFKVMAAFLRLVYNMTQGFTLRYIANGRAYK